LEEGKRYLIAIAFNFPPKLRWDFLAGGCRFQPAFDEIR
jgi:hypothetical protein